MDINIIEEKENLLFNRKEIKFECLYEGEATPKVFEVKNKLVAMLDADKDLLVVDKIDRDSASQGLQGTPNSMNPWRNSGR